MSMGATVKGKAPDHPAVYVTLSDDDYLAVAGLADVDGHSLAGYVRMLVRRHLESIAAAA